jgi:hypothetical protein
VPAGRCGPRPDGPAPATFELAAQLVRPGGHVANIGVHGHPATLHLEDLWIRNVTITTGLVDTYSTPTLLRLVQGHQLDASRFVTHHFTLDQFEKAYEVFGDAADTGALKVVLTRTCGRGDRTPAIGARAMASIGFLADRDSRRVWTLILHGLRPHDLDADDRRGARNRSRQASR